MTHQPALAAQYFCRRIWTVCSLAGCLLLCACGGAQTASSPARGGDGVTSYDLPSSPPAAAPAYTTPYTSPQVPSQGAPQSYAAPTYGQPQGQPYGYGASAQAQQVASNGAVAPVWQPLAARLAADGLSGPRVNALLATLNPTPTQSPMSNTEPLLRLNVETRANRSLLEDKTSEILHFLEERGGAVPA